LLDGGLCVCVCGRLIEGEGEYDLLVYG